MLIPHLAALLIAQTDSPLPQPIVLNRESIARIEVDTPDGKTETTQGVVTPTGLVVASLSNFTSATAVRVLRDSGGIVPVAGVCDYRYEDGVVALAPQWTEAAPAAMTYSPHAPHKGERLRFVSKQVDEQGAETPLGVVADEPGPSMYPVVPIGDLAALVKRGERFLLDDQGRLAGLIVSTTITVGAELKEGVKGGAMLNAVRPEVLGSLTAGDPIVWEDWRTRVLPSLAEAQRHAQAAFALARDSEFEEAEERARECVRLDTRSDEGWAAVAYALARREDYEGSAEAFERAAQLSPANPLWHIGAANALSRSGRLILAMEHADRAVELAPDSGNAHQMRAAVLQFLRRLDDAIVAYKRALELDPLLTDAARELRKLENYRDRR